MVKLYLIAKSPIKLKKEYFVFNNDLNYLVITNESEVNKILFENKNKIIKYYIDSDSNNALFNYESITKYKARIEKGAIIRKNVEIAPSAIILMGAVINIGAKIGENTMIDMNAVIGSGAVIKNNVHVSAGVVISGILEPSSNIPVIIEDNVFIGANSVIKEGIHIEKNSIIGANSFVNKNIKEGTLNYGTPCRYIRNATNEDYEKIKINPLLRASKNNLN